MKLVFVGERDALAEAFVEKMKKEGHDIYFLSEKGVSGNFRISLKSRFYHLSKNTSILEKIFDSICPETIVFAGNAYIDYGNAEWDENYLRLLSRILNNAVRIKAKKFIYLSGGKVYGKLENAAVETDIPQPRTQKGVMLVQGEYMVQQYCKNSGMIPVIVRTSDLYSENCSDQAGDFLSRYITRMKNETEIQIDEGELLQPLHVSDLAEALKRMLGHTEKTVYNVAGGKTIHASELCEMLKKSFHLNAQVTVGKRAPDVQMDSSRVRKELEWIDFKDMEALLEAGNIQYREYEKKKESAKRHFPDTLRRILENVVVFAVFLTISLLTSSHNLFSQVDWMLIYVVLISLFMGLRQSALAVVLASVFYFGVQDISMLEMTNFYSYAKCILKIVEYVFFGIAISYTVDMLREDLRDTKRSYEMLQDDFRELQEINEQNVIIKNEYEKRLLDSRESIPQLYELTERLMILSPDRIFMEILQVMAQLTESNTVAVYSVNPNSTFLRLVNALNDESVVMGKSWDISGQPKLRQAIEQGQLYQGDIWNGDVAVALPIQYHGQSIAVIALRNIDYKKCTLYQMNLLKTVGRLMSESIARAIDYEKITCQDRYVEDSFILKPQAFEEALKLAEEKQEKNLAEYSVLRLYVSGQPKQISDQLVSMFRTADHMGTDNAGNYYVLLSNTGADMAKVVQERLQRKGIRAELSDRPADTGV